MTRLAPVFLALLLTGCGAPLSQAKLGPWVDVTVASQLIVQAECAKRGGALPPAVAYVLVTPTFGCTVWYTDGTVEVFSSDSAGVLLHELDHAFNGKRCHDLLGRPARCDE